MEDTEIIIEDIVSQASLVPNMSEKYRCMVVWDMRENRDVGWIMVKKNGSEVLKSDQVEKMLAKCQLRTCNLKKLKESASVVNDDYEDTSGARGGKGKECIEDDEAVEDIAINCDEASTSTEATKKVSALSVQIQQPGKVLDCAVQGGEEPSSELSEDITEENVLNSKLPLLENDCGVMMSGVDKNIVESVVVTESEDGINNEPSWDPVPTIMHVACSSERKKLKKTRKMGAKQLIKEVKGSEDVKADILIQQPVVDRQASTRSSPRIRGTAGVTRLADWCTCQECGKRIRKQSLYSHMLSVHNITSVLATCNDCGRSVLKINLISHRKKCQFKSCNADKLKESASGSNGSGGAKGKESNDVEDVRNNKEQVSISTTETKEESFLSKQIQQLAKVIDMFENGVDTAPANGNNDDTKDTVADNEHLAVSSKRKKLKKRTKKNSKGSPEDALGKEVMIKPHVADIPASTRSCRTTPGVTGFTD